MSIDDERLRHVGRRAYDLALSGRHNNFGSMQSAIAEEGRAEGVAWLEVPGVMEALEQIWSIAL
jgi:hypothetical protein